MNDIMSFGWHRFWKSNFVKRFSINDFSRPITYLDMSCGSCDIGKKVFKESYKKNQNIVFFFADPNEKMLEQGKKRISDPKIQWICTTAEKTPFIDNYFDLYSIAFGLRNVQNCTDALNEAFRIIKPGGYIFSLEFFQPTNFFLKYAYKLYLRTLPVIGKVVTGHSAPYSYLRTSILAFPSPEKIASAFTNSGFQDVGYTLLSFGIAAIHWGRK